MINKSAFSNSKSPTYDPFHFTETFKEELSSLKKVNQIGKRLTTMSNGEYIMYRGMVFAYDSINPHVSISFLDPKILNVLSPLMPYCVDMHGDLFYKHVTAGDFCGYQVLSNRVELYFDEEQVISEQFEVEKFIKYAKSKGYTDFEVVVAYKKGWETNMDVYNLYLRYLQTLTTRNEMVRESYVLQYTNLDNDIMQKCLTIMEDIQDNGKLLCKKELSAVEVSRVLNNQIPSEYNIPDDNDPTRSYYVRLMKSVCPTISAGSKVNILIISTGKMFNYLVSEVETSGSTVFNIFKVFPM